MDITKIEEKIDRTAAGATQVSMELGGVKFQSMMEVMEFAKLMSVSDLAVPSHLRGNPGACLAVCTKALRFGFDPFSLAEHSFAMKKSTKTASGWEDVETIAFDSYVIRAVINAHAPIKGAISYTYEGEGENRVCIATAVRADDGTVITHKSDTYGKKIAGLPRNDKGQIKGSPLWETKPDVQFAYDTGRDLCRINFPETLLGWYDKDEFEEEVRATTAKDVTPAKPSWKERLEGKKGQRGFSPSHVETTIRESSVALPATADDAQDNALGNDGPGSGEDAVTASPADLLPEEHARSRGYEDGIARKPRRVPPDIDLDYGDHYLNGWDLADGEVQAAQRAGK